MKKWFCCCMLMYNMTDVFAQQLKETEDSLSHHNTLPSVKVYTTNEFGVKFIPEVYGTMIFAGKKNTLINVNQSNGNKSSNNMRELLSRVPGIHIWESDAGGVQPGIATRGMSPNRSWEFNMRQNGFDIAADPYGYPEAYYNPPTTAIHEIEITRGTAALQYGPQFGGLINYKLKNSAELRHPIGFEFENSYSTARLFNSFTGIGFHAKKHNGYVFFNHKNGMGWRENSMLRNNTFYAAIAFQVSSRITIAPELTSFDLLSQQPGGLLDSQLRSNPKQSFRSRNWMGINWLVPGVTFSYQQDSTFTWETKLSGNFSKRNSVLYNQPINIPDTVNAVSGKYANRTVQKDRYEHFQLESKWKKVYGSGVRKHVAVLGFRYFNGYTNRLAEGKGSTGHDYDVSIQGDFNKDIDFNSKNVAVFSENLFRLNEQWLLTIGARYESIKVAASGRNGFSSGNEVLLVPQQKNTNFLLLGAGFEYHLSKTKELYGSVTQCYRPVLFSHLLSPPGTDIIDSSLSNTKGYVVDMGCRSKWKNNFTYDVSLYYIRYADKIGSLLLKKDNNSYRFLTNIGDSYSAGLEAYVEWRKKIKCNKHILDLNIYLTYAFNESRYSKNIKDSSLQNKRVENAPQHIARTGFQINYGHWGVGYQYSYTGFCFSDATNTVLPSTNAQVGKLPAYAIMDLNTEYRLGKLFKIKSGINNLTGRKYFTRRTGGLPGPGALPADGRVVYISLVKSFS